MYELDPRCLLFCSFQYDTLPSCFDDQIQKDKYEIWLYFCRCVPIEGEAGTAVCPLCERLIAIEWFVSLSCRRHTIPVNSDLSSQWDKDELQYLGHNTLVMYTDYTV